MATRREGGKGALVVVDVQVGVVDGAWEADGVVGKVARVEYAEVSHTTATAERLDFSALT